MSIVKGIVGAIKCAPALLKSTAIVAAHACKAKAPQILLIGGIAIATSGTVVACVKTYKEVPKLVEETKQASKDINDSVGTVQVEETTITPDANGRPVETTVLRDYTVEDAKRHLSKLYFRTACKVLKIYWLPTLLVAGGMTLIGCSHGILNKRLLAAIATGESASQLLNQYRKKVIDAEGVDADAKYLKEAVQDIKEAKTDENAKKEVSKTAGLAVLDDSKMRVFDEVSSSKWRREPLFNLATVKAAQHTANSVLKARFRDLGYGFLYLWEVELMCGLMPSKDSYCCGWMYNPTAGDEQVDFGLYKNGIDQIDFLRGIDPNVLLEFNCIYDIQSILSDEKTLDTYIERTAY